MRTIFLSTLVGTLLLACTVETKSSNPPPAEDGGVTGSGDKGGVKTGSPIKAPSTGKDGGTSTQDPPAGAPQTCAAAVDCLGECPDDDDACSEGCYASLPAGEMAELEDLATCIAEAGCETEECLAESCGGPINACMN